MTTHAPGDRDKIPEVDRSQGQVKLFDGSEGLVGAGGKVPIRRRLHVLSDTSYDATSFGEGAELAGGSRGGIEASRIPNMQNISELIGEKMELTHGDVIILSPLVAYVIVGGRSMPRDVAEQGFSASVDATGGGR